MSNPTNRRRRFALTMLTALFTLPFAPLPATAANAAFTVTATSPVTEIQTGEQVDVEVAYSCVGAVACARVVIDLPRPEGLSDEFSSTSGNPTPTTSADVAHVVVNYDKSVRFTFTDPVPAGRVGTISLRYKTDSGPVVNGTPLVVTANATGTNIDPATTSVSVTQTATVAAITSSFYSVTYPEYLDRDIKFSGQVNIDMNNVVGQEGIGSLPTTVTLPAGAVFVSATPTPTSVEGQILRWNDLPGNGLQPYASRNFTVTVRFPTPTFTDGQSSGVTLEAAPVSVGGTPMAPVSRVATVNLRTFNEVFDPATQLLTAGSTIASGFGGNYFIARGADSGFSFYLNNFPSTVPVTSATASADIPASMTVTGIRKPFTNMGVTVHWRTASGATGSFSTDDYPSGTEVGGAPPLADLGVPTGDPIVHLDIDVPEIPGPGGTNVNVLGTFDAPDRSVVRLNSTIVYRADGFADVTRTAGMSYTVIDPLAIPYAGIYTNASTAVRPGDALDWNVYVYGDRVGNRNLEPVVYVPIPAGTVLAEDPVTMGNEFGPPPAGFEDPEMSVVHNDSLGLDVLVLRWPGAPRLDPFEFVQLTVHTTVTTASVGTLTAQVFAGDARGPIDPYPFVSANPPTPKDSVAPSYASRVLDDRNLTGDGASGGMLARGSGTVSVGSGVGVASQLEVQGSLDPEFVIAPQIAATAIGEPITYRLPIENTGNIGLSDMVVYDILPFVGDTGVSQAGAAIPRGSQFTPTLSGPVPAPAGFTVAYSTSTNPCRPEVYPGPAGCSDDWTASPADYSAVRALRFTQTSGTLAPGATSSSTWSMVVPADTPGGQVAVNSVAFAATRADTGAAVTGEPAFATIQVAEADLEVTLTGGNLVADTATPLDLQVSNHGPSAAPGAHVEVTLPDGVSATAPAEQDPAADAAPVAAAAAAATWTCDVTGQTVACDASGPMGVAENTVLPVTVTADVALVKETVEISAVVSGHFPDPNTDNNEVVAVFDVIAEEVTPTPTPTPTPTDGSSETPTDENGGATETPAGGDAGATPSGIPTLGTTEGGGRWLAHTGAPIAGVVLLASLLVGTGLVLRRRRAGACPARDWPLSGLRAPTGCV